MWKPLYPSGPIPESRSSRGSPAARDPRMSSAGEPPGHEENHLIGSRQFPTSPSPILPGILRSVRVLVVDDDEDSVELFAAALTACGAEVVTATNAHDALRVVTLQTLDVVVSDIAMPGADGYWLVREIRQLSGERAKAIPVLAVTAFGRDHVRARSLAAGFVDHLEKPVEPQALCLAVARAAAH